LLIDRVGDIEDCAAVGADLDGLGRLQGKRRIAEDRVIVVEYYRVVHKGARRRGNCCKNPLGGRRDDKQGRDQQQGIANTPARLAREDPDVCDAGHEKKRHREPLARQHHDLRRECRSRGETNCRPTQKQPFPDVVSATDRQDRQTAMNSIC
jgi:hypothetical protein